MEEIHFFEFNLIELIQKIRTPLFDKFFIFFNLIDNAVFIIILIAIIWASNWKVGVKILYVLILGVIFNDFFKIFLKQPRPFNIDPSLFVIYVKGYGFPSGNAQNALFYGGLVIHYLKNKRLAWILGLNIIFWVSLSRIYLGVHFLTDVLGGWVLGFLMLYIYFYFLPKIENFIKKIKISYLFFLGQVLPLFFLFLKGKDYLIFFIIGIMSVNLGLCLSCVFKQYLPVSKNFKEFICRSFLIFLGVFIFSVLLNIPVYMIRLIGIYLIGIWVSFLFNIVWKNFFSDLKFLKK